ncbi:MAG: crossover junction endodeoxyribonuclease RuvC [Spirochaetia bacterium]|nr:crossover junction endodeoxyribonuclease RuvC [Spirochaetota bacterium]MCX8096638.1 crossover junction endodeoxyribonuclease RuvC [Spirochaetota bacterium]MDW8112085.1 crossover junction endodeoxyribonuclease RuvC [Spirochaetia bacterium]
MRVLGIDLGYSILGYGIVEYDGRNLKLITSGVVETSEYTDFNDKIVKINDILSSIISEYSPSAVCIEKVFFGKNVKTAVKVLEVAGVVRILALKSGIKVFEITPLEVKKLITGRKGRHPKVQIQNIVKLILGLDKVPKPDDCADAIAIAIAGLSKIKLKN